MVVSGSFMRIIKMPASTELFKKYPNKWFVETGTYKGDGVQCAIEAGFQGIISTELSSALFNHCKNRKYEFGNRKEKPMVALLCGTSVDNLPHMISDIKEPITFWLDAHYSEGCTAKGDEMSPILKELAIIGNHPIKTHTILIDDRRHFGTHHFGMIKENQIMDALKEINPDYHISKDTGHPDYPMDVLVARI